MLLTQDAAFADGEIAAMLERADLHLGFALLDVLDGELCSHGAAGEPTAGDERFAAFATALRARHGAIVDRSWNRSPSARASGASSRCAACSRGPSSASCWPCC